MINKIKKTSEGWLKDYTDVTILDPDGWDRKNYQYSFKEELISKEEFENRLTWSTCIYKNLMSFGREK